MSLDDLERKLYTRTSEPIRPAARTRQAAAPGKSTAGTPMPKEEWTAEKAAPQEEEPEAEQPRFGRKSIFVAGGIFAVALVVAGFLIFALSDRNVGGVDISIDGPDKLYRGVPFEIIVGISNKMDTVLRSATLTIGLPAGLVSVNGVDSQTALISESIGDVGVGILTQKTYRILPIGDVNSIQKITATLSYGTGGPGRFDAAYSREVSIQNAAITVEVRKLDKILSGSTFDINLDYKNVSGFDFDAVVIDAKYPGAFKFKSSNLAPDSLNSEWRLGQLKSGSKGTLTITGTLEGPQDARFGIPITLSANFLGRSYPLVDQTVDLVMAPSPITIDLSVNGSSDYVARIGDQLVYAVSYKNTSGIALADVVIRAALTGDLFDASTVATDGQFDSVQNTVVWNASNIPTLRLLDPGASGAVNVAVRLKPSFPIRRLSDKNFTVNFSATIDSPSVPFYLSASKTSATANLDTKLAGFLALDADALYRDAAAGLVNLGPFPPRVNQATEYTVHWIIRNFSTDVKGITMSAFLQSGVTWTGQVKSNIASVPLYNERTQEITWAIDKIVATKGVVGDPVEAIFQIRATPNSTRVNQFQPLVGPVKLTAADEFTGAALEAAGKALTTALPDDPTVGQNGGMVLP